MTNDVPIAKNHDLASKLEISGTPTLVIGESMIPGAVSKDDLKELISKARGKS